MVLSTESEEAGLRALPYSTFNSLPLHFSPIHSSHHVCLPHPAMALHLVHYHSAQISEAKELSTGTYCPASTREHFAAVPRKSLKGP